MVLAKLVLLSTLRQLFLSSLGLSWYLLHAYMICRNGNGWIGDGFSITISILVG